MPIVVPRPPFSLITTACASARSPAARNAGDSSKAGTSSIGSIAAARERAEIASRELAEVVREGADRELGQTVRAHLPLAGSKSARSACRSLRSAITPARAPSRRTRRARRSSAPRRRPPASSRHECIESIGLPTSTVRMPDPRRGDRADRRAAGEVAARDEVLGLDAARAAERREVRRASRRRSRSSGSRSP